MKPTTKKTPTLKSQETRSTQKLVRDRIARLAEIQSSGGKIKPTAMLSAFVEAS